MTFAILPQSWHFYPYHLHREAHLAHQFVPKFCNLLRLNILPSKRYLIGKPVSLSLKASMSMAENIMLNSTGAIIQPCLTPIRYLTVTVGDSDIKSSSVPEI